MLTPFEAFAAQMPSKRDGRGTRVLVTSGLPSVPGRSAQLQSKGLWPHSLRQSPQLRRHRGHQATGHKLQTKTYLGLQDLCRQERLHLVTVQAQRELLQPAVEALRGAWEVQAGREVDAELLPIAAAQGLLHRTVQPSTQVAEATQRAPREVGRVPATRLGESTLHLAFTTTRHLQPCGVVEHVPINLPTFKHIRDAPRRFGVATDPQREFRWGLPVEPLRGVLRLRSSTITMMFALFIFIYIYHFISISRIYVYHLFVPHLKAL